MNWQLVRLKLTSNWTELDHPLHALRALQCQALPPCSFEMVLPTGHHKVSSSHETHCPSRSMNLALHTQSSVGRDRLRTFQMSSAFLGDYRACTLETYRRICLRTYFRHWDKGCLHLNLVTCIMTYIVLIMWGLRNMLSGGDALAAFTTNRLERL